MHLGFFWHLPQVAKALIMKSLTYWLLLPANFLIEYPIAAQTAPTRIVCLVEPALELRSGGGNKGILAAIQRRLVYPPQALRAGAEGRVFVSFTVTSTGHVQRITVLKAFRQDCALAAVAAVRQLPLFKPRRKEWGTTGFTVPITFKLTQHPTPKGYHHATSQELTTQRNPNP
jgi:protein TonB